MPRCLTECNFALLSRELKDNCILQAMSPDTASHLQSTYFSLKTEFRLEPYIMQSKNACTRSTIARYRTGCHWLQVAKGRRSQVPYDQRLCPACEGCIEDEAHAIFDCRSYTYQRLIFEDIFDLQQAGAERSLRTFLASNPPHRVAQFLEACRSVREDESHWQYSDVVLSPAMSLEIDGYESSN